ncbi:hypothetical protein HanPI659440_Chr08g0306721 [Helianthus annuus]|nr:hypothetical protein HanPI659440_Chr08g0306721 [Helianthus annuus]
MSTVPVRYRTGAGTGNEKQEKWVPVPNTPVRYLYLPVFYPLIPVPVPKNGESEYRYRKYVIFDFYNLIYGLESCCHFMWLRA